jgi:3-oxoacyl-[acyl-carrier protein] reductase
VTEKAAAIVTGGSRGIGRAICLELARAGFYVVVNYRSNDQAAEELLALIESEGGQGELVPFDVADADQSKDILGPLLERLDRVEVLVNNAGVTADGLLAMMPDEDWHRVIDTTLNGFFNVTRPVVMKMVAQKRGSVVSISSVSALLPNRGQANYSAAKAGLIGASRSLSAEVARLGIRVNVVAPGIIDTEMAEEFPRAMIKQLIPMGRIGKPEEVAKIVRFLCSDDASYLTGQVISVNGGMI